MSDNEDSGSDKEVKDEKEEKEEKEEGGGGKIEGKKFVIKKWHAVTLWTWGTFLFVIISKESRARERQRSVRGAPRLVALLRSSFFPAGRVLMVSIRSLHRELRHLP